MIRNTRKVAPEPELACLEAAANVAQGRLTKLLERMGGHRHARSICDFTEYVADPLLRIVVFGEFSTGKSTLINALLGRRVLPAKARPTTGQVTQLRYGQPEAVRVRMKGGREHQCSFDGLDDFLLLDVHSRARDDIEYIEIHVDSPLLQNGLTLIDTPGLADKAGQSDRATREVSRADVVLFMLDASHLLGVTERHMSVQWLTHELGKPVIPVLNYMNHVEGKERDEVRKMLGTWTHGSLKTCLEQSYYEVNALAALRYVLGTNGQNSPDDNFIALGQALSNLNATKAKRIRLDSRRNHLRALLHSVNSDSLEALERLEKDAEGVHRERQHQLDQLQAAHRRIKESVSLEQSHSVSLAEGKLRKALSNLKARIKRNDGPDLRDKVPGWFKQAANQTLSKIDDDVNERLRSVTHGLDVAIKPITLRELADIEQRARADVHYTFNDTVEKGSTAAGAAAGAAIGTAVLPGVGTIIGGAIGGWLGVLAADHFSTPKVDYVTGQLEAVETDWASVDNLGKEILPTEVETRLNDAAQEIERQIATLRRDTAESGEISERKALQAEVGRILASLDSVSPPQKLVGQRPENSGQRNAKITPATSEPIDKEKQATRIRRKVNHA